MNDQPYTYEYDRDLNPREDSFLRTHQDWRAVLSNSEVIIRFVAANDLALSMKASYHRWGVVATVLLAASLLSALIKIGLAAIGLAPGLVLTAAPPTLGLCGLGVLLWMARRRIKTRWLHAVFVRERIRQWWFQRLLDGHQTSIALADGFDVAFGSAWQSLSAQLADDKVGATCAEYLKQPPGMLNWNVTPYEDATKWEEASALLLQLRVQYQQDFIKTRTTGEGVAVAESPHRRALRAERIEQLVLRVTCALVAVSAAALVVHALGSKSEWSQAFHTAELVAESLALLSLVVFGFARAVELGFQSQREHESYVYYETHVSSIRNRCSASRDPAIRMQLAAELEVAAQEELKRYMLIKTRGQFGAV